MASPILLTENLVLVGLEHWHPINLAMAPGAVVLIHVPSGAGMTALARTVLGLQESRTGCIELFGQNLGSLSERQRQLLRLRAAYLQSVDGEGLMRAWTGFDNLALSWLQHAQGKPLEDRALQTELDAQAHRYGIPTVWLEQPVSHRSRPERLALGLWRLLRSKPELIILEEWPLQSNLISELRMDLLLADALKVQPAILVLTRDSSYGLPKVMSTMQSRFGFIQDGVLTWKSTNFQGSGDVQTG